MNFNVKKCKIMRITKNTNLYISSFSMEKTMMEEVKDFKDLEIISNHHLSWNSHVDNIVSKSD